MSDRPGLELLIRRKTDDGEDAGFEIKVLDSGAVFLALRPTRTADVRVEENAITQADGRFFILRNTASDKYIRVSVREYFLWEKMDGKHTIQDLAAAWFFKFGSFEFEQIRHFLNKARRIGIVSVTGMSMLRKRAARPRSRWDRMLAAIGGFERRVEGVQPQFERLYRVFGFCFAPWLIPIYMAIVGYGLTQYAMERGSGFGAPAWPWWVYGAGILVMLAPALMLHELCHGLACLAAGRKVKAVGVSMLDRLFPTVYVDITDMWMANRWSRMSVSLSGPLFNLVAGSVAVVFARHAGNPTAVWFGLVAADVNYLLALFTAWPFFGIKGDGYNAWTDLVREAALRPRAAAMSRAWATRGATADERWPEGALMLATWLALCAISIAGAAVFVGSHVWRLVG